MNQVYLDAAISFARLGGRLSLDWFRRVDLAVERKADEIKFKKEKD